MGATVCMFVLACGGTSGNEGASPDTGAVSTPAKPDSSAPTHPARPESGQVTTPPPTDTGRDSSGGQSSTNPWESAKQRGIDFRAVGNEPGWYLEIDDGVRILAVVDYGEKRVEMPAPPPAMTDADTRRISYLVQTEAHRMSIVIAEVPCADVMSGEEFPARVTLTLDGKEYQGCGRSLR
jgi:uncharacterized membrane protein